ncbi:hypothetical protein [Aeoliella mucimassa]|uniref:Uncharacterized protein n=1 Tax=Aeoliella mucimassa TaxID=2527972 RepID=A0A518ASL8_9BACT|nr:hypothetical protein [Aeoliella mucimassa]QDU57724.1 hypothetical protein Pan181_39460 [Aeoliella mucimassa]
MKRLARFSLRDVIYVTTIVALALALWLTSRKVPEPTRPGSFPVGGPQTTVTGPLLVNYRQQTSASSSSGSDNVPMRALHFLDDAVVFEYESGGFMYLEKSRIVNLSWRVDE